MRRRTRRTAPAGGASSTTGPQLITTRTRRATESDGDPGLDHEIVLPIGKLQPVEIARRFAPHERRDRAGSVELPTDKSSLGATDMLSSPSKYRSMRAVPGTSAEGDEDVADDELYEAGTVTIEDMTDMILPSMLQYTSKIYKHVSTLEDSTPKRSWWRRLHFIDQHYAPARHVFVSDGEPFISPSDFERAWPGPEESKSFYAAQDIIRTANLVSLIKTAILVPNGLDQPDVVFRRLNNYFPQVFMANSTLNLREIEESYDLAFRIRACLLAELMRQDDRQNAPTLAAGLFCQGVAPRTAKKAKELLQNGPYQSFSSIDVNNAGDLSKVHSARMVDLIACLSHKDKGENLRVLEEAYQPANLLDSLADWARRIYKQLKTDTRGKVGLGGGSAHGIIGDPLPASRSSQGTETTAQRREYLSEIESDSEPESYEEPIQRTEALRASYIDGTATLDRPVSLIHGEPKGTPPSNQQASRILALDLDALVDEERSIRLPSSSRNTQRPPADRNNSVPPSANGPKTGSKRPRVEDEDELDDDEFETNHRPTNGTKRAMRENPASTGPRREGPKTSQLGVAEMPYLQPSSSRGVGVFEILSTQARDAARIARLQQHRPYGVKKREFWNEEDTAQLVKAIPEHYCSWSQIAKVKNLFSTSRSQQSIRDKARNIKVDLLKADKPLFVGFDGIALGKKERAAIEAAGRNPDRLESDVRDGYVTNNLLIPKD
ncbi:hypothetical protein BX600DRAFT_512759 [Xylariales sp. PMI_506]|nr:hypothetical protein BX600DRAFT_512759 [Xylariales sp. PMI_506]